MSVKSLEIFESIGTSPGRAKAHLFFRFFPKKDFSEIEEHLRALGKKTDVNLEIITEVIDNRGFIDTNLKFQQYFLKAMKEFLKFKKEKVEIVRTIGGGGSDAKFFYKKGIPVVEFGVNPYNIHSRNERVDVLEIYISSLLLIKSLLLYSETSST